MTLNEWAIKWGIPFRAVEDLRRAFGEVSTNPETPRIEGLDETAVSNRVRVEATKAGCRLWRNNVGVAFNPSGQPIRYGLCNDSKKMNSLIKSSDLVGIRPILITEDHVGSTIGQFMARETKEQTWSYSGTEHEEAQKRFIELVLSLGGDAAFANDKGTV